MSKFAKSGDAKPGKNYRLVADGNGNVSQLKYPMLATDYVDLNGNRAFVGPKGSVTFGRPLALWEEVTD